jgi:hypothetical protein
MGISERSPGLARCLSCGGLLLRAGARRLAPYYGAGRTQRRALTQSGVVNAARQRVFPPRPPGPRRHESATICKQQKVFTEQTPCTFLDGPCADRCCPSRAERDFPRRVREINRDLQDLRLLSLVFDLVPRARPDCLCAMHTFAISPNPSAQPGCGTTAAMAPAAGFRLVFPLIFTSGDPILLQCSVVDPSPIPPGLLAFARVRPSPAHALSLYWVYRHKTYIVKRNGRGRMSHAGIRAQPSVVSRPSDRPARSAPWER